MTRPLLIAICICLSVPCAMAQTPVETLTAKVDTTLAIEQETQARRDDWAGRRDALEARYHSARANVEFLTTQRDLQQEKVDALELRIVEHQRRLAEAARLRDNLQATLDNVMASLTGWVDQDLPFLAEERRGRIASLREELARPDVPHADKLRRLLEALQIEAAYGGSLEVTQEEIELQGQPVFVDVLRIGRVSLFWRTPDGSRVGEYDRATASWRELPARHARDIGDAMAMAAHLQPIELINLPLGRLSR